jgi:hypothetical protein
MNTDLPAYVVANQAGVHPTKLAKYMKGHLELVGSDLSALASYLKCDPPALQGWCDLSELLEA